jgi:hypothetical protein
MDKLTVEQIAKVASAVTGQDWEVIDGAVSRFVEHGDGQSQNGGWLYYWIPKFANDQDGDAECCMQALALVEWLADHGARITDYDTLVRLASEAFSAITRRDIPALESLVHELLEKKDA